MKTGNYIKPSAELNLKDNRHPAGKIIFLQYLTGQKTHLNY